MGETPLSADTGAATTGPATFSDPGLSWSEDSSPSTPSTETPATDSASADATVPPVAEATTDGTTPASGEPPKERWDPILQNARQKAAEEALAPYAWAKDVNPQEFQQIRSIAKHFANGDPIAGLQSLMAEIRKDPQHDAALRSMAARALAQRSQAPQSPATPDLNPIPLALEDGRTFSAYTAEQVQALVERAVASVKQEFQPVVQTHETLRQERAAAARQQQIDAFVTTTYADVQTWPGMSDKANQVAVANAMAAMKVDPDDPREVSLALNRAYRDQVIPKLSHSAEAKLLDTLKTKAAASSSVNPGSAGASAPRSPRSFHDPSLQW